MVNRKQSGRDADWAGAAARLGCTAFLVAGMVAATGSAVAQSAMPDAQVESNVLKALAGAPELSNEAVTTRTVYGTVTLSGSVQTEAQRQKAEQLAANAVGVQKVIDELRVGTADAAGSAQAATQAGGAAPGMVLQSDGTYASAAATDGQPAPGSAPAAMAQRNDPDSDQALDQQVEQQQGTVSAGTGSMPATGDQTPYGGSPSGQYPNGGGGMAQSQPTPYSPDGRRPLNPAYPQNGYPQAGYGQAPYPQAYPQQAYPQQGYQQGGGYAGAPYGGQVAGQTVVVPSGTMVRVRLNQGVSSQHSQPGSPFTGIVVNDVTAGGAVAIPLGAAVAGTVIDAKSSGVLKGRGELSIALNSVSMGGRTYSLQTLPWAHNGGDKTIETVDKTAGLGAVGAVFGALAGGGVGAAVGGGIGAAAGLGSSAASGRGQVFIPAEGLVSFSLAQPASVSTVSEQEMQRLAYGAGPQGQPAYYGQRRRPYYGPAYYPGYPSPYGYPPQ